jgi:hypothetical protein
MLRKVWHPKEQVYWIFPLCQELQIPKKEYLFIRHTANFVMAKKLKG